MIRDVYFEQSKSYGKDLREQYGELFSAAHRFLFGANRVTYSEKNGWRIDVEKPQLTGLSLIGAGATIIALPVIPKTISAAIGFIGGTYSIVTISSWILQNTSSTYTQKLLIANIHQSAKLGNAKELKKLLGKCDTDNMKDRALDDGRLLQIVVKIRNKECLQVLWDFYIGNDPSDHQEGRVTEAWIHANADSTTESALHAAARLGMETIVCVLLDNFCRYGDTKFDAIKPSVHSSVLHEAAEEGKNENIIKRVQIFYDSIVHTYPDYIYNFPDRPGMKALALYRGDHANPA